MREDGINSEHSETWNADLLYNSEPSLRIFNIEITCC